MKNKKDSYYYSAEEWSRSIGYGEVPPERLKPTPPEDKVTTHEKQQHMAGEYVSYEDKVTTHEEQQEWLKNVRKTKY
jgi:hypothetical protein